MEELNNIGDIYLENKEYIKAINCYLKCIEIGDNSYIKLKVSYLYLLLKDYQNSFYYFISSYQLEEDYINIDYNLGIYLFSMLINLPSKYLTDVKKMNFKDVEILDTDIGYENKEFQNSIRKLILNRNFKLVSECLAEKEDVNIYNLLIKELVNNIVEFQKEEKEYLLELIKNNDYKEVAIYLEDVNKYQKLSKELKYILKLVKELINLKDNAEMINKVNFKTTSVYKAIDCRNYELALELERNNVKDNLDNDMLYLLLSEIVKEIKAIERAEQEDVLDIDLGEIWELDCPNLDLPLDYSTVFNKIVNYLDNNDLYNVYKEIDSFLISISKVNYRFLIIDLIKLSKLEKVKSIIEELYLGTYHFRIGEYLNDFYDSLVNKKYKEAHIYLDIIKNGWRLGSDFRLINDLEKILNRRDKKEDNSLTIKLSLKNKKYD